MSATTREKTELQREILLTWYENPNATKKEIAEACHCSASYVSQVTNRFDNYDHMEAMIDRQDKEMEQMFGDDFFHPMQSESSQSVVGEGDTASLAEIYTELPDNLIGYVLKAGILLFVLYIFYEMALVLVA
ncbi:hypothetical protein C483_02650 [Natrialba hulunbeirensis JCM 10989]|uniref:Winged helix-turn-helix domain-containing protein n=1 Tax=Natrialba hulunbeirensis JCM 10989 TaxID=1227493 RepID=M0A770_9EURY|nr:hypothetical protein [Natrialba hulunbeirensis]ELY94595.1 hypothetical protein C483_02650 [Natrialba hulunbeirensis JCM 10989]